MTNTTQTNAFTSFLGGTQQQHQNLNGNTERQAGPGPSPQQVKLYIESCERKRVQPQDTTKMTRAEISAEISRIMDMPFPASDAQLKIIYDTMNLLKNGGVNINISQERIDSLTGGRGGTASKMIEFLFQLQSEHAVEGPMTEKQADIITEWYLCPDIPFESFSTEEIFPLKEGANENEMMTKTVSIERFAKVMRPDISETAWEKRMFTPEEFRAELMSKLNGRQASAFIDRYRDDFYQWRRTRVTQKQIKLIQTLEERLASLYVPSEVTMAIDEDGNVYEVPNKKVDLYNPVAFEPMDMIQLAQMSFEDASKLIEMYQSDLANNDYMSRATDDQSELNEKHSTFNPERGTGRVTHDMLEARIREYHLINDFLFAMDSILGYTNDHMHAELTETIIEGKADGTEYGNKLSRLMLESIDFSTDNNRKRSIGRLHTLTEESVVLSEILESLLSNMDKIAQ